MVSLFAVSAIARSVIKFDIKISSSVSTLYLETHCQRYHCLTLYPTNTTRGGQGQRPSPQHLPLSPTCSPRPQATTNTCLTIVYTTPQGYKGLLLVDAGIPSETRIIEYTGVVYTRTEYLAQRAAHPNIQHYAA